jgi:hypothetical protein
MNVQHLLQNYYEGTGIMLCMRLSANGGNMKLVLARNLLVPLPSLGQHHSAVFTSVLARPSPPPQHRVRLPSHNNSPEIAPFMQGFTEPQKAR